MSEPQPEKSPTRLEKLRTKREAIEASLVELQNRFETSYDESSFFAYIKSESSPEFAKRWLEKVRSETSLFKGIDELGIRLFVDDLEEQNSLAIESSLGVQVTFDPDLRTEHLQNPKACGFAEIGGKNVKLKAEKPVLREQLRHFISEGTLHPSVAFLTHELVHKYHFDLNPDIDTELTEGQAYCNGLIQSLQYGSIEATSSHLEQDYGIPKERALSIVRNILFLYARGESPRKVADRLRNINPSLQGHWALEEFHIKPIIEGEEITEEEKEEMIQVFILENELERIRARMLFIEVFGEVMEG